MLVADALAFLPEGAVVALLVPGATFTFRAYLHPTEEAEFLRALHGRPEALYVPDAKPSGDLPAYRVGELRCLDGTIEIRRVVPGSAEVKALARAAAVPAGEGGARSWVATPSA